MPRRPLREAGNATRMTDALWESAFLRACRGLEARPTPVWLMRQAGRYMAEYRAVRTGRSFLDMCRPEIATEVTVTAQRRIAADAAIVFADILLILQGLGMELGFGAGEGPQLAPPLRSAAEVDRLGHPSAAAKACDYVAETCARCRAALAPDIPLIGFAGAPFTLAAYAIEGHGSRQFAAARALMYGDEATWHRLQETLVAALVPYLQAQVARGAQALQIFDSWAGILPEAEYRKFALPHLRALVAAMPEGVPVIVFGTNTAHLLGCFAETGCDVVGIDATTDLVAAWDRLGGPERISVQGNLDPALLLAPRARLLAAADRLLDAVDGRPGHIFNLGHGVMKETDVEQVVALVEHVHRRTG